MIVKVKNTKEKSIVINYINRKYGTNYPITFFINVKGYICVDGSDYTFFTSEDKAIAYLLDNHEKGILNFSEFTEMLIDEINELQQKYNNVLDAYLETKMRCVKAESKLHISKKLFNTCFQIK